MSSHLDLDLDPDLQPRSEELPTRSTGWVWEGVRDPTRKSSSRVEGRRRKNVSKRSVWRFYIFWGLSRSLILARP
jgi:hypothetical protein